MCGVQRSGAYRAVGVAVLALSAALVAGCGSQAASSRGLDDGAEPATAAVESPAGAQASAAPASVTEPSVEPSAEASEPRASASPSDPAPLEGALTAPSGQPWVVSLGDSYISGEAGRWAGNQTYSTNAIDALGSAAYGDSSGNESIPRCHRSRSAAIHIGDVPSENLACSGATTSTHVDSHGYFKPGIDFFDKDGKQGQATMLQEFASTHRVGMVAMSIGGNDFKFAPIIEECIKSYLKPAIFGSYCQEDKDVRGYIDDMAVNRVRGDISRSILNVAKAMDRAGYDDSQWTLVMQLYPDAIARPETMRYPESGYDRQLEGGCGFRDDDAAWALDTVIPLINQTVTDAVVEAHDARPSLQIGILNTKGAFAGHALCDKAVKRVQAPGGVKNWQEPDAVDTSEWVMEINMVNPHDTYQQESVHPNYWGQMALRSCWRQVWNGGKVRGGSCEIAGRGLTQLGEPKMKVN